MKSALFGSRRGRTFDRGIDLPHHKHYTDTRAVERLPLPPEVVIPLQQHTGSVTEPLVRVGDRVTAGRKIGDLEDRWCAAVHASVSGTVVAVEPRPFGDGRLVTSVVIERDPDSGTDEPTRRTGENWRDLEPEQILRILKESGIVGMAGAGFPTHINLAVRTRIPLLIVNGAECEPFLTSDHRTMLERTDAVIGGAEIIMHCIGAERCVFGVETNKPDAIELLQERIRDIPHMSVVPVAVKYPQGYKKTLLRAITGKEPPLGGRSADVGCIVRNVSTTAAIHDAVVLGKPLYERVVTVTGPGPLAGAGNYLVPIGTSVRHILEMVGVDARDLDGYKIIRGGPMTGLAIDTLDAPVVKPTTGILVMPPGEIQPEYSRINPCIRCSACVNHCPVGIYPNEISQLVEAGVPEEAHRLHINECCECAICSYVCPAFRPVTDLVMEGKAILCRREEENAPG
ncbi:MAG: electron transport complex subunit RsxC [Spirochaetaceae bacterium]|nr:MAG: electron transport complex subunit RsxC [Spirochaetaceae bacterium]